MVKIYTKTGDKGETGLYGGKRIGKNNTRIRAIGVVDELNANLGVALSFSQIKDIEAIVNPIQEHLFELGAALANSQENFKESTETLEKTIDKLEKTLEPLRNFILPGGSQAAALWHLARTVCRRAERILVTLSKKETMEPEILMYINRLSDLLFVLARAENKTSNIPDKPWQPSI